MGKHKIFSRCPKCKWRFEVERPDDFHRTHSLVKPQANDVMEDIKEQVYDCRNPDCLNPITVYWFEPKRSFERF